MKVLTNKIEFPNVNEATEEGLLAIGGDLSIERLILAYKTGVFPWFNSDDNFIMWWSPDPRFILFPEKLKVSKSMRQVLRNSNFEMTVNSHFPQVIKECSKAKRDGQAGTWITQSMINAYIELHKLGYVKSVEVWQDAKLVGGLYGVDLGNGIFYGESMFSKVSNASKVAFIIFIQNTDYNLIDCQVYTSHLSSLGAEEIPRDEFMKFLI